MHIKNVSAGKEILPPVTLSAFPAALQKKNTETSFNSEHMVSGQQPFPKNDQQLREHRTKNSTKELAMGSINLTH